MAIEKCLSVVVLVTVITIVQTKSVGNVPQSANITGSHANIATTKNSQQIDLKESLNDLRSKYQHTLLNETILPFLNNCSIVHMVTSPPSTTTQTSSVPKRPDGNLLCLVYFDMVNNLAKSGFSDYQTAQSIFDTLEAYNKESIIGNFCNLFAGEIPSEAEKRPYETRIASGNMSSGQMLKSSHACNLLCFEFNAETYQARIKPICKMISGGYRALNLHLIIHDVPEQPQKPTLTKIVDASSANAVSEAVKPVAFSSPSLSPVEAVAVVPAAPVPVAAAAAPIIVQTASNTENRSAAKALEPIAPEIINAAAEPVSVVPSVPVKPVIAVGANVDSSNRTHSSSASPAPVVNRTGDNVAAPSSNDKAITKEMKPTQKDVDPFLVPEANEEADKNDNPPEIEDSYDGDTGDTQSNVMTIERKQNNNDDTETNEEDENLVQSQDEQDIQHNNIRNDKQHIDLMTGDGAGHSNDEQAQIVRNDPFFQDENSSFFSYFMFALMASATIYVVYHNKSKIMALMLEGRRSRTSSSRGGRRKHRAAYRKLDCNLEEAISSSGKVSSSQVIY